MGAPYIYDISRLRVNTTEKKIFVIIEHRTTVFRFDYLNMFPIDGPQAMREITSSDSKKVSYHRSFVGWEIHSGRMVDKILRHISLTILLAVEIPIR